MTKYCLSKDQDVKANKVRVALVGCRRLMVNEYEALEAVADKVDDDIDPIPKDESAIVINWRHGRTYVLDDGTQRFTRRALRPNERRYKNHFITDPNAPNAGKDAPYVDQDTSKVMV